MSRNYHDDSRQDIVSGDFGGGFIPIDDLVENVEAWRQRKTLCEDVDLIEQKGGSQKRDPRNELFLQGAKNRPSKRNKLLIDSREDSHVWHKRNSIRSTSE